ncbi:sugar porter family MFS transporter [Alterisphingorhabdus coralli]|uniref:Sugar porter family MFS transporter n=1 Tax=Alterisphingorhabdus coralli TaxID=3071408 RepID=A0AA97F8M4_9SPHN|nr:sugar porter family MFS transporter [Parasphingorhabdus sp. SCSIO 66989]WOE75516.1 sugar porter family MFS transporter [Parasphingorhabdus sp. SCSIO 66989]
MAEASAAADSAPSDSAHNLGFITLIVSVATLGGFLFGYDSGVINGTVDGLQQAFDSDSVGTGFNVASMLLGCALGAFAAGRMADVFGRRRILLVSAALFLISAWGSGIAGGSTEFVFYRLLGGLAVGAASVLAPVYISEVTPASLRGRLSSIQQIMIIVGLTAAFLSNYIIAGAAGASTEIWWAGYEAWRWMFWAELIPAGIFLFALLVIPESPRFLVSKGEDAQAEAVLANVVGPDQAPAKVDAIRTTLSEDHRPQMSDLIDKNSGKIRTIVWVGIGLAVFQQLVGINVVFYYGAVLWQAVGFSEADALKINILSGTLSIASCLAAIALIDRIGRKPLLLIGSAGMVITLGAMAIAFSSGSFVDGALQLSDGAGLVALIAANAYAALFNFSWGPVMWVMLGEMFPNQIRGSGLAVSGFAQWAANFGITLSFPVLLAGIGLAGAYGLYALAALISVFFVWIMVRETRGMELEEMVG